MKYPPGRRVRRLAHGHAGLAGPGVHRRDHAVLPRAAGVADARRHRVDGRAGYARVVEQGEAADPRAGLGHSPVAGDHAARLHDAQERLDVAPAAVGARAHDVACVAGCGERQRVDAHDAAGRGLVDDTWTGVHQPGAGHGSRPWHWVTESRTTMRGLMMTSRLNAL